jgi:hypothetical protein
MTVAIAAVHKMLRYKGKDSGLFYLVLDDGDVYVSRRRPALYGSDARPIPTRELEPGSYVNVLYSVDRRRKLMEAIQLISEPPEEESPFRRVGR